MISKDPFCLILWCLVELKSYSHHFLLYQNPLQTAYKAPPYSQGISEKKWPDHHLTEEEGEINVNSKDWAIDKDCI